MAIEKVALPVCHSQHIEKSPLNNFFSRRRRGVAEQTIKLHVFQSSPPRFPLLSWCRSCLDPERALGEEPSSEGYATPRSLETPVQMASKCSSLNLIRDPFRPPRGHFDIVSTHPMVEDLHSGGLKRAATTGARKQPPPKAPIDDIYTILIRFPPKESGPVHVKSSSKRQSASIQMLTDQAWQDGGLSPSRRHYPRSLPVIRRFEDMAVPPRSSTVSATTDDIVKLPLDAKLVPRQLIKSQPSTDAPSSSQSPHNTLQVKKTTKTKKTSEKKQERKAAKTLSAILLAFIITWTPYSVLAVLNAVLGKQLAVNYIPDILWKFSYYLCYINSTVNPVLYALCNAAFRRTYVRILTCRWRSQLRQPVNRYFYN